MSVQRAENDGGSIIDATLAPIERRPWHHRNHYARSDDPEFNAEQDRLTEESKAQRRMLSKLLSIFFAVVLSFCMLAWMFTRDI